MRKQHYKRSLSGLAAGLMLAMPAFGAEGSGWFFGLNLTRTEAKLSVPGIIFDGREDTSVKFSAGYQITPRWKAELNYLDIGKSSLTNNSLGIALAQENRGKGLQLVGTATMPLSEKFGLYGKLGAFHSNLESSCATNILICTAADRGTDLSYGVGLRYDFTKTVSVPGEWERFRRFGGRDAVGEVDKDFFTVGLGFKF